MTYRNLETIGKAIAYKMVDKDEKSSIQILENIENKIILEIVTFISYFQKYHIQL